MRKRSRSPPPQGGERDTMTHNNDTPAKRRGRWNGPAAPSADRSPPENSPRSPN